jgi:hypothetical protein
MKFSIVPLLALAICVAANVGQSADKPAQKPPAESAPRKDSPKYLLQYKFREGEEIRAKVGHLATVETTISGSTQKTEMKSYSTKLWRVVRVDPSGAMTFEHLVENVDMRNQMSGRQEVRYNSLTDTAAPLGYEDVAKSIGKVLSAVTISPSGNVLKREEKQVRSVADNSGSVLIPRLPDEPAPIGQVWSLPVEVNVALEDGASKAIQTRQRYELEKVEDGVATIAVETQILTPVSNPKIRVQLIQRLSKGHIRFDLDAGRILSQRTDLDERVLGFSGGDSSMHYVARFTEELLPAAPKTAAIK